MKCRLHLLPLFLRSCFSLSRDLKWLPLNISYSYSSIAISVSVAIDLTLYLGWSWVLIMSDKSLSAKKNKKTEYSTGQVMWNNITYVTIFLSRVWLCTYTWVSAQANQLSISWVKPPWVTADLLHIIPMSTKFQLLSRFCQSDCMTLQL